MQESRPEKTNVVAPNVCPVCGRRLPPEVPPARCPHCLLRQGLPTGPLDAQGETVGAQEPDGCRVLPQAGEVFGHYRIVRLLGHGGMGAAFEAEDLESGRRVALKVLSHRLDSPEARNRFFREGRLAASVNHPNSVYVFGTEDIAGIPVIAMELVGGGTLQDRVSEGGPLPVAEVVDSVLQVIAGLEAAQRVGVLHRDIKPSNCFVEADGTVKIGDFGLSISTFVRTEPAITATGAFLGTPAFSSPEQLRGDELTVRSDIYSVGVTLYYLLTGHHPFEAPNVVQLLATVLERRAESPAKRRPDLPGTLCRTVLRCLEKDPEKRFRNYDDLRNALLPFASAAPTPASLGLRFLAHCLDGLLLALPYSAINLLVRGAGEASHLLLVQVLLMSLGHIALAVAYYGSLEGLWGASVGKFLCRLRVACLDRTVPGVPRAALRALILTAIPSTVSLLGRAAVGTSLSGGSADPWDSAFGLLSVGITALLFVTARRRNGFAGVHDLCSRTRVIVKSAYQARPVLPSASENLPNTETLPGIGPYHVLDRLGDAGDTELLLGFDARLLRRVWIRRLPPGAPSVPVELRQLGRPGRLRWLTGQRTETEAWDAYEAAAGQPLLALISEPQSWERVRYWLLDLAEELHVAAGDGSLPERLCLDRVWITADGRARLLDFPVPGMASPQPGQRLQSEIVALAPATFLRQVAEAALEGYPSKPNGKRADTARVPLALHARHFLETLKTGNNLQTSIANLRPLLDFPAQVTRARRAVLLAGVLAFPLLTTLVGGGLYVVRAVVQKNQPELATLLECLAHHQQLVQEVHSGQADKVPVRDAFEVYVAGRFGPVITNAAVWNRILTQIAVFEPLRSNAEAILARTSPPTPGQLEEATAKVTAFFKKSPDEAARGSMEEIPLPVAAMLVGYGNGVVFVVVPCLVASLLFRGGALVRLLGIAYVNRRGELASRGRVAARAVVAWLPFLLLPFAVRGLTPLFGSTGALILVLGTAAGLTLTSVLLPVRGLADRVAGTWLVPR